MKVANPAIHWHWWRPETPGGAGEALARWLEAAVAGQAAAPAAAIAAQAEALRPAVEKLIAARDQHAAAEGLLRAVLQSVDSAILALTTSHHRLYANAAAERLFGLAPGDTRVVGLQRFPQLVQWIDAARQGEGEASESAGRVALADGRTLQVFVGPLPSDPPGSIVVARDITETVRLETARRDFIAAISHELRTPLTSIQGYAEILQDNPELPTGEREQFLAIMLQNTTRLASLARDLVTLSSIETGTYPFHFQELEVASLVEAAVGVMTPLAREHRGRIRVEALAPGRARIDPEAMHRVLLNLIENAILHGGAGPERPQGLEVSLRGETAGGEYRLQVRDTGAGISSADQPRIFERFYRVAARAENGAGHGTGLGLALVKHIVREHGGRIELVSALGEGSTFTVCLPLLASTTNTRTIA